jgi:hypothetical protein
LKALAFSLQASLKTNDLVIEYLQKF